MKKATAWRIIPGWIRLLLLSLILLGIVFRLNNLDGKVYWHDEAYTSIRAAGYRGADIDDALFSNQLFTAPDLQQYQTLNPNSTVQDTLNSLAIEDPQHPPLYFILSRWWMQLFGSSLTAQRSLAALVSLFSLPAIYALGVELFQSRLVGGIAAALLALSPFDILYAETNRQYSLQTFLIILSSWLLLRALRQRKWWLWGIYGIIAAAGLYTQPLCALTFLVHGLYVLLLCWQDSPRLTFARLRYGGRWQPLWAFCGAMAIALLLFAPWAVILFQNRGQAIATTAWTGTAVGLDYLFKLWLLSFTSLFIDLDFGFFNPVTFWLRIPFLLLILGSLYVVCRRTSYSTGLFIVSMTIIPFMILVIPDLLIDGKRSAISRYLIPCFPAVQLAVAYWISQDFLPGKHIWQRWVLPMILVASLVSNSASDRASSWWSKDLSYHNDDIAAVLNQGNQSVLLSDRGPILTNRGDLLSLSYELDNTVQLLLLDQPPDLSALNTLSNLQTRSLFTFRPTDALRDAIEQRGTLEPVDTLPDDSTNWGIWSIVLNPAN